ncbi:MAG: GlsB/YeaQ/YmgE family stress response membrane protein [Acetobacteraceae bacterium]|nr:GlsB/YeaQ/YmgE family stress response membrane protein [Acetobacteraceae bacterium]
MLSFIGAIIIGGLAGAVARFLMPGRDPGGIILTILLGIAGSVVATWLGREIGWYRYGEGAGFIGSVIGAIIILIIYRMLARPRTY